MLYTWRYVPAATCASYKLIGIGSRAQAYRVFSSPPMATHGATAHARLSFAAARPAAPPAIEPDAIAACERVLGSALHTTCSARRAPTLTSPFLLCVWQEVSFYSDGTVLQAVTHFERHLLVGILCSRTPSSQRSVMDI
jgi:hypothetical protein